MLPTSILVALILTIVFGIISTYFNLSTLKLVPEQRLFMIVSNVLLILLFGVLGSSLIQEPSFIHTVGNISIFYIIWYFCTFSLVNYLSSDTNGVLRY